jgi:hypothetical protein
LATEHYIKRYDRVCVQLHFNICKKIGVKLDTKHWYDQVPKSFETSNEGKVTILWNQSVRTDRTIPNNKPNIIICIAIYYSLKHNNINHQIINILNSRQHVLATVGNHQAKLEQSLGILNVRTLWDPISFTLLITLNVINRLMY